MQDTRRKIDTSRMSSAAVARAYGLRPERAYRDGLVSERPAAHPMVQQESRGPDPKPAKQGDRARLVNAEIARLTAAVSAQTGMPQGMLSRGSDAAKTGLQSGRSAVVYLAHRRGIQEPEIAEALSMRPDDVARVLDDVAANRRRHVTKIIQDVQDAGGV